MQTRTIGYALVAVLVAATFAVTGCEKVLAPPRYAAEQATVGVDPSGDTLDTSTVPPKDPDDALVDQSRVPQPKPKPQPKPEPRAEPAPTQTPPETQQPDATNDTSVGSTDGGVSITAVPPDSGSDTAGGVGMPQPSRRHHHLAGD